MRKTRVYIASPYTMGSMTRNIRFQYDIWKQLFDLGYCPYSPVVGSHFIDIVHPHHYEDWLAYDFEWIRACDCLLRCGGESPGGDREVEFAIRNNIPVYFSIEDLLKQQPKQREV